MAEHAKQAAPAAVEAEPAVAQGAEGGSGINPMEQFEIKRLADWNIGGLDVSFTNASLWMVIGVCVASLIVLAGSSKLVPGRMQSIGELIYEFISGMMRDILGDSGRSFFPLIFTLFMFVLSANMLGMVPYSFTTTSQIIVTFGLAAFVFVGATIVGFYKHGFHYLKLFVPSGVPSVLLPMLVVIEVISYFTRPISLSVRLFANMMAGHTMLKVFASFVVAMGFLGGWMPLAMMVALTGLEILIAFLQAYVFAVLTCIYLNDAINMH